MAAAPSTALRMLAFASVASLLGVASAHAQSMTTNSADFNAGYGRRAGSENHPVTFATRDANGNRVIIDGLIQTGEDQSSFSFGSGAGEAYSGVGSLGGGSTAIGNSLVVVTQGNYNTVIVNSTQTNNGAVSAGTTLNGGVAPDGQ
ncbi:endonuclease [Phenylobacterium sp. Root77]|uniref:holdfast anchoring protein HfaA n=2 Tax=Phenylobacterium TaxID=20 RepID=UPI0006F97379|nr:endonuclease [Phenylobacterium sp. Root1277]KQW91329.1 endonuclease [Phenylobacterium sp. Root1290]KRC39735.1 endonuclease [Phenylobacterium sp. Root77]